MSGQSTQYQIVAQNLGLCGIDDVEIELPIPNGLRVLSTSPTASRDNDRLFWDVGNLEKSGLRRLNVELLASQAGEVRLTPSARFTAGASARTRIVRSQCVLDVNSPDSANLGETVLLQIQVGNHSATPIRQVSLRCELSNGLAHPQGQLIEADLGEDLAPGQIRTVELETRAVQPGPQHVDFIAFAEGNQVARTSAAILIQGTGTRLETSGSRESSAAENSAVRTVLELTPMQDPLFEGEETDYEIRLYNAGMKPARSVRVVVFLPDVFSLVNGVGPTQGQVSGQTISFEPLPELNRRVDAIYRLRIRGVKPGEGTFRVTVQATGQNQPLEQRLTSHVRTTQGRVP